ncbi:MAG: prefoldin subunit alpha [Candidatus Micrarchaeaceae archaeon]
MANENPKPNTQQSVEELKYIQQVYQNQYSIASNSINMALQELQELNSAQKTLENADLLEGKDMIMSIGAAFYSVNRIKDSKTFLVGVGANYLVEKTTDEAKEHVAKIIEKSNDNLNRLMKNRKELEAALIEISYKIDSMA